MAPLRHLLQLSVRPAVTAANGLPSGVNVTLSNQTYTYNSATTSDSAIVTADAAYTISSKTHSRHGTNTIR